MLNIGVIFGGRSCEHDVSIITGIQVINAIDKQKYKVHPIYLKDGNIYMGDVLSDITFYQNSNFKKCQKVVLINGVFYQKAKNILVKRCKIDVGIICCHGGEGENGVIAGLLEYNKIPYTSSDVRGLALTMDKVSTKQVLDGLMQNTLPNIVITRDDYLDNTNDVIRHVETFLDYPMIVKPASLGSSIGITKVNDIDELKDGMDVAFHFDRKVIIEKALTDFIELNCAVVLSNNEIIVSEVERPLNIGEILTFDDKYLNNGKMQNSGREFPAKIDKSIYEDVQNLSKRVYQELDLYGVVRVDYLLTKDNKLFINEINAIPGSLAFYLFDGIISFDELLDAMIIGALSRFEDNNKNKLAYKSDLLGNFGKASNKYLRK